MKIAAFGDFHAHMFAEFADVDDITGNSRFTQQLKALEYMRQYCITQGIPFLLFAGDMFHKRKAVDTTTFNSILEELKKFPANGVEVVMIPGNHDQVDNSDYPEHSLRAFKEVNGIHVLDEFKAKTFHHGEQTVTIYPLPYSKNVDLVKMSIEEYVEHTKLNQETCKVLLGHVGITGAYLGKGNYTMVDAYSVGDLRPDVFDFGVFGHFHRRQFLGGSSHYFYTGAPLQHSFNDEGEGKGFMVLNSVTKDVEFVHIPAPEFITVKITEDMDLEKKQKELEGNFIRYQVDVDKVDQVLDKIPEGQKYRMETIKEFKEEKRVDIDLSMSFVDIITKYAKEFNPDALDVGLNILREVEGK